MNEEQMRKEFEEWFCNEYLFGGGVVNYGCRTTYIAWNAWQASRKAIKPVKLPKLMKNTQEQACYYYNDAIAECKEAIQQAGHEVEE